MLNFSGMYEYLDVLNSQLNKNQLIKNESFEKLKSIVSNQNCVGLAQINPIAGDLEYNSKKIIKYIQVATNLDLAVIIFPQNALVGAELKSFITRYPFFVDENLKWLKGIAKQAKNTVVVLPFIDNDKSFSTAILRNGKIENILKTDLISSKYVNDGAEYLIKMVSVPSRLNSQYLREMFLKKEAVSKKRIIVEVNQVGAVDNLSYDGMSCVVDENGDVFARARGFEEQLLIVNPLCKIGKLYEKNPTQPQVEFSLDYEKDLERVYKSSVQGIKDYFSKCGIKRAVLGLSGGLDSSVCAVLLADALGNANVFGISMPSKLTSNESKSDAYNLAQNLGINFLEYPIKTLFETFTSEFSNIFEVVDSKWACRYKQSFTPDNIQARTRAMYLWGIANEFESCTPIATSDKSELYMGYATINGDMSGGFAPIADITKTKLFALADWMNKNRTKKNAIPQSVLEKRPGAELAIDPNTGKTLCAEDALMPYEFLDEIIWRVENKNQSYTELLKTEFIYEKKMNITLEQKIEWLTKFYRRMSFALYKGYIMPPSTIIDTYSINKSDYAQPITSSKIDYVGKNEMEIDGLFSHDFLSDF